jgi:GNAT superfamily N-acetyltransferase
VLRRELPSWNRTEYERRLSAQERGELVQALAWDGPSPVGRAMLLFPEHLEHSVSARREGCAEARDVFVPEPHRRRGLARALMRFLEEVAASRGLPVGLSVSHADRSAAPARALYASLGYRHAHGPFLTSARLDGDDGPILVGAILDYLVRTS